ncbi:hypothetical protein P8452_74843 [Trifolium repens]|nr:hypothetical protein P8452_74834 [Trifolium repens]WJX93295.1 hypothetical protein P8452_74838 [Trifolium repens]WJX93302.1 hypothetical protein P8452_74843 [Trifolium repens]
MNLFLFHLVLQAYREAGTAWLASLCYIRAPFHICHKAGERIHVACVYSGVNWDCECFCEIIKFCLVFKAEIAYNKMWDACYQGHGLGLGWRVMHIKVNLFS